jgi:hypothetical protein
MDFASLKDQVANLSLYDLKAGVRKVQNGEVVPKNHFVHSKSDEHADPPPHSGYELYRNGGKSNSYAPFGMRIADNSVQGSRSNEQRTMGRFLYLNARYRQWNLQLVGEPRYMFLTALTFLSVNYLTKLCP